MVVAITVVTFIINVEIRYVEAEGMEKTFKFKQSDIAGAVDVASAQKVRCWFAAGQ